MQCFRMFRIVGDMVSTVSNGLGFGWIVLNVKEEWIGFVHACQGHGISTQSRTGTPMCLVRTVPCRSDSIAVVSIVGTAAIVTRVTIPIKEQKLVWGRTVAVQQNVGRITTVVDAAIVMGQVKSSQMRQRGKDIQTAHDFSTS